MLDTVKDFICGCVSGWAQVVVMQPFEIVKVRLVNQSSLNPQYTGIIDCVKKIKSQEGLLAFYKGTLTPLLSVGAQVALMFGSNGLIKRLLHKQSQGQGHIPNMGVVFISGFLTGFPSSIVGTPVDRTRMLVQMQKGNDSKNKYHSSLDAGIQIYKKYGIKALYLGFYPVLLRQVLALSIYFSVSDFGMRLFSKDGNNPNQAPLLVAFFAGGLAGCFSWIVTYPIDYIKTVIQSQGPTQIRYKSGYECMKIKYRQQGIKTFFKGFGVAIIRSFPVNGVGFFSFQMMKRFTGRKTISETKEKEQNL